MKKTVSINLGGLAFKIDEDAFIVLESYINTIKSKFNNEVEQKEIISDIEYRIGELFNKNLNSQFREVVNLDDVNEVVKKLGKPETIAGEEEGTTHKNYSQNNSNSIESEKRLFRNIDDKIISGICSGLSAYLGINDPIWMRIVFALLFFISAGTLIIIYIIGIIIIPEAKTTSQKLQMRGQPVTIQNIEENFSHLKDSINNPKLSNGIHSVLGVIWKIIRYGVGGILTFLGIAMLFGLVITFISGNPNSLHFSSFNMISKYLVNDTQSIAIYVVTIFLVLGIPALSILLMGIRMLINRNFLSTIHRLILLGLWLIGLLSLGLLIKKGFHEVASSGQVEHKLLLNTNAQTISLQSNDDIDYEVNHDGISINGNKMENGKLTIPNTELNIKKSLTGETYMIQLLKSNGNSTSNATKLANEIDAKFEQRDSIVFIDQLFTIKNTHPIFRNQRVRYTLYLPLGKRIYLDESSRNLIYDIKNVHNMIDNKMLGHTWEMTTEGLVCVDCSEEYKTKHSLDYSGDDDEEEIEIEEMKNGKFIKKIRTKNFHIKDGDDEVTMKNGKLIIKDGEEEVVVDVN